MGYKELTDDLIRSAEDKSRTILERARREAEALTAHAAEEAGRTEREFREAVALEVGRERAVRMNRARTESRALLHRSRTALAEEVLTRLEKELREVPREKDYPLVAGRLFKEILPELPDGPLRILADDKAASVIRPVKDRTARFEPLPAEEIGGFEVSDEAGRIVIRNTLRSRFMKARPELMVEINRWMSGHERPALS